MPEPPAIPAGWQPLRWAGELDRKAATCEELRPDLAAEYRERARVVRDLYGVSSRPVYKGVVVAEYCSDG